MRTLRTRIRTLPALALLVGAAAAQDGLEAGGPEENGRWYLQLGAGISGPPEDDSAPGGNLEFDTGYGLSALVGLHLGEFLDAERVTWDLELEGFVTSADVDMHGFLNVAASEPETLSTTALLVNGMFNWHVAPDVAVYAGGGVGYATDVEFESLDDTNPYLPRDDDGFAWQGKVGMLYRLGGASNFAWTLGYRYFQTEDVPLVDTMGATFDLENVTHVFEVGVRWGI